MRVRFKMSTLFRSLQLVGSLPTWTLSINIFESFNYNLYYIYFVYIIHNILCKISKEKINQIILGNLFPKFGRRTQVPRLSISSWKPFSSTIIITIIKFSKIPEYTLMHNNYNLSACIGKQISLNCSSTAIPIYKY